MSKSILNYLRFFGTTQDDVMLDCINELEESGLYDVRVDANAGIVAVPYNQTESRPLLMAHMDTICDHRLTGYDNWESEVVGDFLQLSAKAKLAVLKPSYNKWTKQTTTFSTPTVQCLGADDRSGVATIFAVLDELKEQGRTDFPIIIFCREEEVGGKTRELYNFIEAEQIDIDTNLMIEIDTPNWNTSTFREFGFGSNEGDPRLKKMLERFGYIEHTGTAVTDCATLGKYLDVPSISVAASYENEHTPDERLSISHWSKNFNRLMQVYNKIKGREFSFDYSYKYSGKWDGSNWGTSYPNYNWGGLYSGGSSLGSYYDKYLEEDDFLESDYRLNAPVDEPLLMGDEESVIAELVYILDLYGIEENKSNHIINEVTKILNK